MDNLAMAYGKLGRHADALATLQSVLECRLRVLPKNHPLIGEGHVLRVSLPALFVLWRSGFSFHVQAIPYLVLL